MKKRIAEVDWDYAYTVSSEREGEETNTVYFDVAQGDDGWYLSIDIDCEVGHFTECISADDGPYETEEKAISAAFDGALDWFFTNEYQCEELSIDPDIVKMGLVWWLKDEGK